jgi:uncharacterized protein (DUF983 family)
MSESGTMTHRPINLSENGGARFLQALGRGTMRHCPYCGGGGIFQGWFSLKKRCPSCNVLFEPEDGYLLGAYVVNIGITAISAVAIVISLMIWSSMSVVQIQLIGAALAIGIPIFMYPYTLLFWIALDLAFFGHGDYSDNRRK